MLIQELRPNLNPIIPDTTTSLRTISKQLLDKQGEYGRLLQEESYATVCNRYTNHVLFNY